jgi:pimeloyl-ACP methyl ester carboxylesterase
MGERWAVFFCWLAALLGWPSLAVGQLETFAVKGFHPASVVVPRGAGKRPVMIALHGNFDRPEWICQAMTELVQGRAWIVCPRGVPRVDVPRGYDRWTFAARGRVLAESEAGLAELRRRYPERLEEGAIWLAGFSLGAILAARFAVAAPERFPNLYLVEGAHQVWTGAAIQQFARHGGKAVVFGCGHRGCTTQSRRICQALRQVEVSCSEVAVPGLGHSYTAPLPEKARPLFEAMVAKDSRWNMQPSH